MSKWKLFIKRYNISANDYIVEERIVETNDLYHEIGKIYCTRLEDIKDIRYYEIDEKKELQQRIDKAIEYMKPRFMNNIGKDGFEDYDIDQIYKILKGEE